MTPHTLYVSRGSAPCRSVLLTLAMLRESTALDVEIVDVDLRKGEHRTPDYLALNPLHTVPTLERDGQGLRESRAIMRYLCSLTSAQSLYPDYPWTRAQIDALLDWDASGFYPAVADVVYPQVFRDDTPTAAAEARMKQMLATLDTYLEDGRPHLTGERLTLADVCLATSATMLELVVMRPFADQPHIEAWIERLGGHPVWAKVNEPFEAWKREYALR